MDRRTSYTAIEPIEDRAKPRSAARNAVWIALASGLIVSGAALGYRLGRNGQDVPDWLPSSLAKVLTGTAAAPRLPPTGPIIYYSDPDGRPFYSEGPKNTADGRPFVAVRASEDLAFEGPAEAVIEGKRILYYRNPMGLPGTSPVPKKDSMGMDYLPVYEGEEADDGSVKISLGKIQRAGVRSEPASRRTIARMIRVPGTVQLDERRITVVAMRADSFIEHVENVTTGDHVRKGQRLLEVFSPEVNAAAAQMISDPGFEGSRRRLENLNVPAEAISAIERTRKVPLTIAWSAPRDGIVLERNATDGMKASSGQVLFRLADISTIWILADVPERDIGTIAVGQSVAIRARSIPGHSFPGRVALIYPQVNPETRTVRVRIEIDNKDGTLLPDMYADVDVVAGSQTPVVTVPENALIDTGTRQIVILDKGDGRFEPRDVKVGTRGEDLVEVREGVNEGDKVVVSANFLIDAESNLKTALRGMKTPETPR